MKSKSSTKRNRRTKRQKKSLQFDPLEPRQMLTFFTPGPSDAALFNTVTTLDTETSEDFSFFSGDRNQLNVVDGGRIGIDDFDGAGIQARIAGVELNFSGGNLGDNLSIVTTEANVSGGVIGNNVSFAFSENVLNVTGGEIGDRLRLGQGRANISGGTIGDEFRVRAPDNPPEDELTTSSVNISGGEIGDFLNTSHGSFIFISGGVIGDSFIADSSFVQISGGKIGSNFSALRGATVDIGGGEIGSGDGAFMISGSEVNLSGGVVQDRLSLDSGELNLFVLEYQLDGVPQNSSAIGESVTILDREVLVTGLLSDGTAFSFDLTDRDGFPDQDFYGSTAILNVTLVDKPEVLNEASTITGDLSGSRTTRTTTRLRGFVNASDPDANGTGQFIPQIVTNGTYGTFSLNTNKINAEWRYEIDVDSVSDLAVGQSVSESFEIVAVDGTTEFVTVTINGFNQVVIANDTTFEIAEDARVGAVLGRVLASNPDGPNPSISILSGNEAGVFTVDSFGNVTVADASQLDFETTPEYVLVFEASDGATTDTATLTISVIDVQTAAVIGGDITGSATEDRATTGLLTISDADGADEEAFVAEFIQGTYGQIGIQADGNYRYRPSTDPVTQALRAGEIVADTFTLTSVDGTTVDVTISIEGINDPATFPGTAPVQISEDATAPLTGQINVEDRDAGESEIIPSQQTGRFGVFEINAAGQWNYTVDNVAANRVPAGRELIDPFVITSLDGTEQDFFVEVVGVNDVAVITGTNTGTINEDSTTPVRGVLGVDDPDLGERVFAEQLTPEQGSFGVFQRNGGLWSYTINSDAGAGLNATETATDTFEVSSIDGSATVLVTITIVGQNDYFDDVVTTEAGTPVTFNAFENDEAAGDVIVTSSLATEGGDISIGANGEVTYTPSENANLNGTDSFQLTFEDENGTIGRSNVSVTVNKAAPVEDVFVFGTTQDDFLEGNDLNNVLIGDLGSDILVGSRGNDIFITDAVNGDFNGNDRDVIRLGNVDGNDSGNDVVTDFDVNGTNGGENNFDALEFTFNDQDFSISSRNDIRRFVRFIEGDGDVRTDAILDGNDLILVFGRDSEDPSIITSSVRLEDVVGQNGLTEGRLRRDSVDQLGTAELDVFFASGAVEIGSTASETLVGGTANDVIVGGAGSDTLFGGAGNDTLTGDQTNGGIFGNDQDTFAISEIVPGNVGNDVITDFDTNNFNGGENNHDTLTLTLNNQDFSLSTGRDFLEFAEFLDNDGNDDTGTLIDGNDIIFVFGRNDLGFITDSVRLQDIIGDDGLTNASLAAFNRVGESGRLDVFIV